MATWAAVWFLQDCDAMWEDFHNKLVDSTLLNLDEYLQQFPDLKVLKFVFDKIIFYSVDIENDSSSKNWNISDSCGQKKSETHWLRQRSSSRRNSAGLRDEERPQNDEGGSTHPGFDVGGIYLLKLLVKLVCGGPS